MLAASLVGCGPSLIAVPSEHPLRTAAASPNPSATLRPATMPPATAEPAIPIEGNILAAAGAIALANVKPRADGNWLLEIDVVQHDRAVISGSIAFGTPTGWNARTQAGKVRLTADGWAAIDIESQNELAADNNGVVVINVLGIGEASGAIGGVALGWLPDGTLLLERDSATVVRRIAEHGLGEIQDLADDQAYPERVWHHGPVIERDLSGVVAWEREYGLPPYVTMRWDGAIVPRALTAPVLLMRGIERLVGADRAQTQAHQLCHFEDLCPLDWRRRDGTLLPIPGAPADTAWTRDGTGLVVLEPFGHDDLGGSQVALVRDGPAGLDILPLDEVPFPELAHGQITWLEGMTDWAVVIENDENEVVVMPLDGSRAIGPFDGWLALVNP